MGETMFRRCIPACAALVACVGGRAPADAEEFYLEIATDWCDCAERDLPGEIPADGIETCPTDLLGAVMFFSSDDECVYDEDRALACIETTRGGEVTCAPGGAVSYDGVPFEDIAACEAAWRCAS